MEGLNTELQYALQTNDYASFQKLVDKAIMTEKKGHELEEEKKRKLHQGQSSGSNTRPRFNPLVTGQFQQQMQRPSFPAYR